MKINSIKLKELDTRFTMKPTRTAEIKTREGTIETPSRAATMFEYNSKAKIPTNVLIDNPITVKYTSLGYNTLRNFLQTNEVFARLHHAQENTMDRTQHSQLQFALFQPTITEYKDENIPAAMQILQESKELEKFLDLIISLQESLHFDIISLPYLFLPYTKLENIYKKRAAQIRQLGKEPFFVLNLKHNPPDFEKLVELFVNELNLKLIGLNFQRFPKAALNYRTISKYYDKDVLFFSLQVGRSDPAHDDISSSHYLPFLTNDIFAVAAPQYFDPSKKKKNIESGIEQPSKIPSYQEKLLQLKLFNKKDLSLDSIFPLMNQHKELLKDVGNPKDERLVQMIKNYMTEGNTKEEQKERITNLKSFTWVHELKTSVSEFTNFRNFIKQNDTSFYVTERPLLNSTISDMN